MRRDINNNNTKLLTVRNPSVCGYLIHAFYLSILPHDSNFEAWYNSNYIELSFVNDFALEDVHYMDFYDSIRYCPFINEKVVKYEHLKSLNDVNDFMFENIDNGCYIRLCLDEFYIKSRNNYMRDHYMHDFMIHGYDKDNELYYEQGFSKNQVYQENVLSFEEFRLGLLSVYDGYDAVELKGTYDVLLVSVDKNFTYKFDINVFLEKIKNYRYSTRHEVLPTLGYKGDPSTVVFGMDIYDSLVLLYDNIVNEKALNDIRPIHFLYEHKKCISERMQYLYDNGYLSTNELTDEYKKLELHANTIRNMHLKYNISNDVRLIDKIVEGIIDVKQYELVVLDKLISKF